MVIEINTNTLGTVHINQYTPKFMFRSQSKKRVTRNRATVRAWYDVLMPTPPTSTPTSAYFLQSVTIYNSATVGNVSISTVSYSPLSLRLRHTLQVQTTTVSPTLRRNASAFLEVSGRGSTSRATILLTASACYTSFIRLQFDSYVQAIM